VILDALGHVWVNFQIKKPMSISQKRPDARQHMRSHTSSERLVTGDQLKSRNPMLRSIQAALT
jgi:hypothetical protein